MFDHLLREWMGENDPPSPIICHYTIGSHGARPYNWSLTPGGSGRGKKIGDGVVLHFTGCTVQQRRAAIRFFSRRVFSESQKEGTGNGE